MDPLNAAFGDTSTIVYAAVGVAAVAVLVVVLRKRKATGPAMRPGAPTPAPSARPGRGESLDLVVGSPEVDRAAFLSRFVVNAKGDRVGETVGFYQDRVVLKQTGTFYAVPLTQVLEKDGALLATADIDWDEAQRTGETWRADTTDEMRYDEHGMPILDEKA